MREKESGSYLVRVRQSGGERAGERERAGARERKRERERERDGERAIEWE